MVSNILIFFVASPLQVIASSMIAKDIIHKKKLSKPKCILICYKPTLQEIVSDPIWDNTLYIPWPRYEPLPGFFGVSKRLLSNIKLVGTTIEKKTNIYCFSAAYDNEAVNYFINYFKKNSTNSSFSLIPDGALNLIRYPQSLMSRILKILRIFRLSYSRNLRYTFYSGDRFGADADFVKSIYVIPGLRTEYNPAKVVQLKPFFSTKVIKADQKKRALIIGQPLTGYKLIDRHRLMHISREIREWSFAHDIEDVFYKTHPKDKEKNLFEEGYKLLSEKVLIENFLSNNYFDYVIGVHSSVLIFAKQLYGNQTEVISFGLDKLKFKNQSLKIKLYNLYQELGIIIR